MILGDLRIREWAESGGIDGYDSSLVNPASIDLRLGNYMRFALDDRWSEEFEIRKEGSRIKPNELVLLHTLEYIRIPSNLTGLLFLKSSAGRLGWEHLHAGYIDPGFEGELTLEIMNQARWANKIYPRMRMMQLCLVETTEVESPYEVQGHYQGQLGATITREGYKQ